MSHENKPVNGLKQLPLSGDVLRGPFRSADRLIVALRSGAINAARAEDERLPR